MKDGRVRIFLLKTEPVHLSGYNNVTLYYTDVRLKEPQDQDRLKNVSLYRTKLYNLYFL